MNNKTNKNYQTIPKGRLMEEKDKALNKTFQVPHTYIIISAVICLMAVLTWFVPLGKFQVQEKKYKVIQNGVEREKTKTVPIRDSFTIVKDKSGNSLYGKKGVLDVLKAPYLGFTDHDAVEVIAFILLIGGAFGILIRTRAVEASLLKIISKVKGTEFLIIPVVMLTFSLGGAVFGLSEETIPFTMILVPIAISMGYDSITALCMGFLASQIGFATAFMNPFTLGVAQGIAGIKFMSGFQVRFGIWLLFTIISIITVMIYAKKIKKDPTSSITYETDKKWREQIEKDDIVNTEFTRGHLLIMLSFAGCMIWMIYGVIQEGYYLEEISMIFMAVGVLAGIIAVCSKIMTVNQVAKAFEAGAADLLTAAIIVGFAKGILYVMGGKEPTSPSVLNTFLYYTSKQLESFGPSICAFFMYCFQSVFNFFVVSGSGQAALTMPIMAPLADMVGVTKEVAILAFQFGDGITNMIVPTSSVLIGVLSVAKVPWTKWAKWQIKWQFFLFILCTITLMVAVKFGFGS